MRKFSNPFTPYWCHVGACFTINSLILGLVSATVTSVREDTFSYYANGISCSISNTEANRLFGLGEIRLA